MSKEKVLFVVGPTASGKTNVAVYLSKNLNGEVISADSMQVYKDINIISAKPTKEDMSGVHHYLIDFLDCKKDFSVSSFVNLSKNSIKKIKEKEKQPIICGGTGLYIDSLVNNIEFREDTSSDDTIRNKLNDIALNNGNIYIYEMLKKIDPEMALKIHENNTIKIIRALEVFYKTGETMSKVQKQAASQNSFINPCYIGLNYRDREKLYDKINRRVDIMVENGLVEEAFSLYEKGGFSKTIGQAIGFKELTPYFDGNETLDNCLVNVKMFSRRYAKRQLTWFRKNKNISWFYVDDYIDINSMYNDIYGKCQQFILG
ncbi:MAG: tRNA (adenosine(37)-N6)-dimethylallyltransferase MiaA [Oscillospiraceae bacterium]